MKMPTKAQFVEWGRQGGLSGGKIRAANLSAQRRREIAKKAGQTRWKKQRTIKRNCPICAEKIRGKFARYCDECQPILRKIHKAMRQAVSLAVATGKLDRPEKLLCKDCGASAEMYDHRDYGKPLEVEPVCRKCNNHRGPAVAFGKWGTKRLEQILERGLVRS